MIDPGELFARERAQLVRHAYRMLGSMSDAEDAVQDAFLRWQSASRDDVRDPHAFLRATVTRIAIDRLRAQRRARETYIGPWLPEPVIVDESTAPERMVALAEDISFGFLLALERLSPLERAAFLLHDALDVPFAEIAQTLERSEESVRRLASRARRAIHETAPRRIERPHNADELRDRFGAALLNGDVETVMSMLTEDALLLSDGGGKKTAAINPVKGRDHVGRGMLGLARKAAGRFTSVQPLRVNGLPGWAFFTGEGLDQTMAIELDAEGRVETIYVTRNPEKLARLKASLGPGTSPLPISAGDPAPSLD